MAATLLIRTAQALYGADATRIEHTRGIGFAYLTQDVRTHYLDMAAAALVVALGEPVEPPPLEVVR